MLGMCTDMAAALDEVKDELNDHVVLAPQDFCDSVGDPSASLASAPVSRSTRGGRDTHFFMTCTLTFCISTFWLNSGGNLVLLSSFASTPVAMVAVVFQAFARTARRGRGLWLG